METFFVYNLLHCQNKKNKCNYYYVSPDNVWLAKISENSANDCQRVCESVRTEEYPQETDNNECGRDTNVI